MMNHSGLIVLFVMVLLSVVLAEPHCLRPANLQFGGWYASKQGYSIGTVVTYHCLPGYNLVGSRTTICATDRAHAFWVGSPPRCVRHGQSTDVAKLTFK